VTPGGVLYVVATPIGNLDDISPRARDTLRAADLIAAEDTRHTRQLLTHFGIQTELISLHEHNERQRTESLLDRLAGGASIALVSDAGTPLVSDPGYRLVAGARERGFTVSPIPGCCAAVAALSAAGLPSDRFFFEGFLPARGKARRARLDALRNCRDTLILYEAVHRVGSTLADLIATLGPTRPAVVARELTKLHESFYAGTLAKIAALLAADPGGGKGEFTLVIGGGAESRVSYELDRIVTLLLAELPPAKAAGLAAQITGVPRADAYAAALRAGRRPVSDPAE
jgi:16S rRNA (cytidine1402-2'-O)-methyltransferase